MFLFRGLETMRIILSEWHKNAISKPRNPVITRLFRWAKLAENADFGKEYIAKLRHKGILVRIGNNRTGYWEIKSP
jgi:predicted HTH transcriptional regulator